MRKQTKRTFPSILTILLGVALVGAAIFWSSYKIPEAPEEEETGPLPVLNITLNGTTLAEMKEGSKDIIYPDNQVVLKNSGDSTVFQNVEIKGRGNSTWMWPEKKPWQLKLNAEADILGMGVAKKWVLLADAYDASHLRNFTAFQFTKMIEPKYYKVGQMVEVNFDGKYEGIYYMIPKIEVDKNFVNLTNELGALVELDDIRVDSDYYYSYARNRIFLKGGASEKNDELKAVAMADFMLNFNNLEKAVSEKKYKKFEGLADVTSFAEAYLINEFAVNPDAYTASFYMYKDGLDDKIHVGPVWDFDYSFGNHEWDNGENIKNFYSPTETMVLKSRAYNQLVYGMMDMPEFQTEVKRIFKEKLAGRKDEFMGILYAEADRIKAAVEKDADLWEYENYESETEYVLDWINQRFEYFEEVYGE